MKKFLLVVLFIGCDCSDDHVVDEPLGQLVEDDYTSNDPEENNILRPCPTYDVKCIRYYFAKNALCSPAYGKVPDPLIFTRTSLPLAISNLTVILTEVRVNGLNGKVVEFYVNKMNNIVVLAVELQNLTVFSPAAYFLYHRKAMEPIVTTDFTNVTYRSVTLTAVLPCVDDMQLANSEISAFIDDSSPNFAIGPKAGQDPALLSSYNQFVSNANVNIREAFIVQGPLFMNLFIQNRICDFGLKVVSY